MSSAGVKTSHSSRIQTMSRSIAFSPAGTKLARIGDGMVQILGQYSDRYEIEAIIFCTWACLLLAQCGLKYNRWDVIWSSRNKCIRDLQRGRDPGLEMAGTGLRGRTIYSKVVR